jgi:hypothetical protein
MTRKERQRQLQAILNQHDAMAARFRESLEAAHAGGAAVRAASARMEESHARIEDMTAAINEALTAMIAANRAALALFNDEDEPDRTEEA